MANIQNSSTFVTLTQVAGHQGQDERAHRHEEQDASDFVQRRVIRARFVFVVQPENLGGDNPERNRGQKYRDLELGRIAAVPFDTAGDQYGEDERQREPDQVRCEQQSSQEPSSARGTPCITPPCQDRERPVVECRERHGRRRSCRRTERGGSRGRITRRPGRQATDGSLPYRPLTKSSAKHKHSPFPAHPASPARRPYSTQPDDPRQPRPEKPTLVNGMMRLSSRSPGAPRSSLERATRPHRPRFSSPSPR